MAAVTAKLMREQRLLES